MSGGLKIPKSEHVAGDSRIDDVPVVITVMVIIAMVILVFVADGSPRVVVLHFKTSSITQTVVTSKSNLH